MDALYVVCFFAIMSAAAIAVSWLAHQMQALGVDPFIIWMVRGVEMIIAAFDCLGVICGAGYSLYRFIKALMDDDKNGHV